MGVWGAELRLWCCPRAQQPGTSSGLPTRGQQVPPAKTKTAPGKSLLQPAGALGAAPAAGPLNQAENGASIPRQRLGPSSASDQSFWRGGSDWEMPL